jgi:multiple sugar transport system substrate-binding protein
MVATSAVGCSANKTSSTTSTAASGTAASVSSSVAKVTLTMWDYFEGANSQKAMSELVNGFNSSQSNITMKAVFTPRDEMDKQLSIGLVSGKLPDVVLIDGCDYASRISMGLFADVTDDFNQDFGSQVSDFYAGPLLTCKSGDKYYGVPFGCNDIGLFYNNDMLKSANISTPPTTWDEMNADCAKLSNTKTGVYGLAISAIKNDEGSFQFMPWLTSTGATYDKVNTAAGIKSFTLLQNLVKNGYLSQESINWTQADAEKQFATGKAAMMINGPWNIASVQTDAPKLNFGIGQIPKDAQYASVTGGEDMGIIKGHNEAAGWQFLKFATNNSLLYIDDMGYIPSRKSVAAQDKTLESPLMSPFVNILTYATPRGPSAQWPQVSAALYTAEQEVMLDQKTPTAAANEAQASIDSALK